MNKMNSELKRKRGRKSIDISKRALTRMITLYDNHFKIIDDNQIELSNFTRWLLQNKQEQYNFGDRKENNEGNSSQTSVSLYQVELESIEVNNLSSFIRYGLENYIDEYLQK